MIVSSELHNDKLHNTSIIIIFIVHNIYKYIYIYIYIYIYNYTFVHNYIINNIIYILIYIEIKIFNDMLIFYNWFNFNLWGYAK